ncbi:MAG: TRAP transporter small permease [Planctomycetota bacterium]|nr:TRAP transporter small permease [Planctomycetota bacterium]
MGAEPGSADSIAGKFIRGMEKTLDIINSSISGASFVGMFFVVLAAIAMRFVLKIPFFWGEEAARYLMLVGIYFGMSIAVREKAHLGVDVFVNLLPPCVSRFVRLTAVVITTAVYLATTKICWDFAARMQKGSQTSPAMSIPMWMVYGIIFLGFAMCALESLVLVWRECLFPVGTMKEGAEKPEDEKVRLI